MAHDLSKTLTKVAPRSVSSLILGNKTSGNDLMKTNNELNREIQHASEKVRDERERALENLKEWRRKQIEDIEQRYSIQWINFNERFNRLTSLEQDVRNRFATEVDKPLTDPNVYDDIRTAVGKAVDLIYQDVWQLRWTAPTKDHQVCSIRS